MWSETVVRQFLNESNVPLDGDKEEEEEEEEVIECSRKPEKVTDLCSREFPETRKLIYTQCKEATKNRYRQ